MLHLTRNFSFLIFYFSSIGLLTSSDDNDTDDKDEVFEDDDGIPSFDEEEPRTPQRKPKVSKLSKKKRLSNDQVQKVLDSSDEDTPVKKRCVAQTPPIHYGLNCRILSKNYIDFFTYKIQIYDLVFKPSSLLLVTNNKYQPSHV